METPDRFDQALGSRRRHPHEGARCVPLPVVERSRREPRQRTFERLGGRSDGEHDVRRCEVDSEPGGAGVQVAEHGRAGELLEEVLDLVLLGQPLDHFDLLRRHRGMTRNCTREVDLRTVFGDERAEQFPACDERNSDTRPPSVTSKLRPEIGEPELGRRGRPARRRAVEQEPLGRAVLEVEMHRLRAEQDKRPLGNDMSQVVERLGGCDRLSQLGQALEIVHPAAHLLVELCVLDRSREQRRARDEELRLGLGEFARRLGVEQDRAERLALPRQNRDRYERLEALLLELGHVLEARVLERTVANERGLAVLERPPR